MSDEKREQTKVFWSTSGPWSCSSVLSSIMCAHAQVHAARSRTLNKQGDPTWA